MELLELLNDWFFYTISDIIVEGLFYVILALAFIAAMLHLTGNKKRNGKNKTSN
jgi:hypothetical protein